MKRAFIGCIAMLLLMGEASLLFAKRKPLARPTLDRIEYQATGTGLSADPKTGELVSYAIEGAITYDRRSGNFLLTWMGARGSRLTVVYEPRLKVDAIVSAAVAYDSEGKRYRYAYSIRSLQSSQQKLQSLYVETRATVEQVKSPDLSWRSRAATEHVKGKLQIAGGQSWSQTRNGHVGLVPGTGASGFSYESAGLPALVKCYVRGHTSLQNVGEVMPEELIVAFGKADWIIPQGVTVGAEIPVHPFRTGPFVRQLGEYVSTSLDNGWIESAQIAQQFKSAMADLQEAIDKGEKPRAAKILSDLLAHVEREKDKALLSEAYALLKFNLKYLQQRLEEK